jgi:hypothetical protein
MNIDNVQIFIIDDVVGCIFSIRYLILYYPFIYK